jgi:2-phosphoglycerate kinase
MPRRLLLIGGSAGGGKTSTARSLAADLGAGWLQLDTVWVALKAAAGRGTPAFARLDIDGRLRGGGDLDEDLLAAQVAASEAVCEVLPPVLELELAAHPVLVSDGTWLLPSFVAALEPPETEVRCVFLQHGDVEGLAAALAPRLGGRPAEARHLRTNRALWEYGRWIGEQAAAHDFPVLEAEPFATLTARVRAALGTDSDQADG